MHRHPVVAVLALLLFCHGCASRELHFVSNPPGASVSVAAAQCTTPCTLVVECDEPRAMFADQQGRHQSAELPACGEEDARDSRSLQRGELALAISAFALFIVAVGAYLVGAYGEQDSDELTGNDDAWMVSIASGGTALLMISASNYLHSRHNAENTTTVSVDFDAPNPEPGSAPATD